MMAAVKKQKPSCFLLTDLYRMFTSVQFYFAIVMVITLLFIGLESKQNYGISVLNIFLRSICSKAFMVCFVACAVPFSGVFLEDFETQFIRYAVIRGNLKKYVVSKICTIIISSILVMSIACLLFCEINRLWLPMTDHISLSYTKVQFHIFYNTKYILLWIFLWGVRMGVEAAILAVLASLISLFITNRLLLATIPMLAYELLQELDIELYEKGIHLYDRNWFRMDIQTNLSDSLIILYVLLSFFICMALFSKLILWKIKRRI